MNAYFDSGVLVKNYCEEADTAKAISLIIAEQLPLPITRLQEAEVRNALRLKLFRNEITKSELDQALKLLDTDLREGRFEKCPHTENGIYRRAEHLSRLHTSEIGARMLDILHVAAALEIGSTRFISFDQRQRAIAKKAGLKVLPRT